MLEIVESHTSPARIKVFGVGGGGSNAVNRMIQAGLAGVEFWVANTDLQALEKSPSPNRLQIGKAVTRGLGAGGDPEVGRLSGEESRDAIAEALHGADMLFVTAGMGGGTGTGAAPVVAGIAKELGVLTVAIVTKPFVFEGKKKMARALRGLEELGACVDTLIAIPNQKLLSIVSHGTPLHEALLTADEVLFQATRGISDLITGHGLINLDFADINAVMRNRGNALLGCGSAGGKDRAVEAAQAAVSSPLLEEVSIMGAEAVLINVHGGPGLGLHEAAEAAEFIQGRVGEEADVFLGAVIDPSLDDEIRVTLIATGFDGVRPANAQHASAGDGAKSAAPARLSAAGSTGGAGVPAESPRPEKPEQVPAPQLQLHTFQSFRVDAAMTESAQERASAPGPEQEAAHRAHALDEDLSFDSWPSGIEAGSELFLPEERPVRSGGPARGLDLRSLRGESQDPVQTRARTRLPQAGGDSLEPRLGRRSPLDEPAFMRKRMD